MDIGYHDDRRVSDYWLKINSNINFNNCKKTLLDCSHRYGDRYLMSYLGRVFAVTWCIISLIINPMLVSVLTSSPSALVIEETIRGNPGKLVGVIKESPGEYFVNVLKRSGGTGKDQFRLKRGK